MADKSREKLTTVKLYGALRKFGREFTVSVKDTREALRAVFMQVEGLKEYIEDCERKGIEFAVFNGKRNISKDELDFSPKEVVKLAPVYGGRKRNGLLQTIIGVVLVVVSFWVPPAWGAFGGMLMSSGVGLALGGVVQMLTKPMGGLSDSSDSENRASYAFGQPVNTTAQGVAVPLWYGYREVGGSVISAAILAEDSQ